MTLRTVVGILMLSPVYFRMPLRARLILIQECYADFPGLQMPDSRSCC